MCKINVLRGYFIHDCGWCWAVSAIENLTCNITFFQSNSLVWWIEISGFCCHNNLNMPGATLVLADYAVIAATLLISSAIGIYYRMTGGRQRTVEVGQIFFLSFSLFITIWSSTRSRWLHCYVTSKMKYFEFANKCETCYSKEDFYNDLFLKLLSRTRTE